MDKSSKRAINKLIQHQLKMNQLKIKHNNKHAVYASEYVALIRQLRKYLKALDNGSKAQPKFRRLSLDAVRTSIIPKSLSKKLVFILKDYTIDFRDGLAKVIHILRIDFDKE